jgi:hypothetical protein
MSYGRLDAAKRKPIIDHRLGVRKSDLADRRTQVRRDAQALAQHLACGLVRAFAGPAPINADHNSLQTT